MPSFAPSLTLTSLPGSVAKPTPLIAAGNPDWQFSLHNVLGIVNPLQHLPVVGTLYRAITGDKIGVPEKIAGDALYGGLWGAVSSIADTAFQAYTGKDFGSTMLAMVTGGSGRDASGPIAVAANDAPTAPNVSALDLAAPSLPNTGIADTAAAAATPATPDVVALTSALALKGIDSDTAQRALMAYRRSQAPQGASTGALLAVAQ